MNPLGKPLLDAPDSDEELFLRATSISGRTLGELADLADLPVPRDSLNAKGFGGQVVERVLGGTAGSASEPDFQLLGVELKTVPIDAKGQPMEATFVTVVDLNELIGIPFGESRAAHKLRRVLFVPIEGTRTLMPSVRRVGVPVLWRPGPDQWAQLEEDYGLLAERALNGLPITASHGVVLHVRPKTVQRNGKGSNAYYLRAAFTARVLS